MWLFIGPSIYVMVPFIGNLARIALLKNLFLESMYLAPEAVEFSFNNIMHSQTNSVVMGSPFGPILANIFVGSHEQLLFDKPYVYMWYVDERFSIFDSATDFFEDHSSLHPSLQITMEVDSDGTLPFLDVLLGRKDVFFYNSIFRKPTFTGL